MSLSTIDLIVVIVYAIGIFSLAQFVSREKAGHEKDTSDYFLASKNLPWWAIGASLIAANSAPVTARPLMPSSSAIAAAVMAWSPVIIRTRMPACLALAICAWFWSQMGNVIVRLGPRMASTIWLRSMRRSPRD